MLDNELKSYLLPNLFNAAVRAGAAIMQVYKNKAIEDVVFAPVRDESNEENVGNNVGPATAIAILGSLSVEQFKQAVVSGDVSGIARAKGVGKKTAERIVLELKDKVGLAATWEAQAQGATSQAAGDAELALIALGFKQVESRKAIAAHLKDHPDADADELIRAALRSMN